MINVQPAKTLAVRSGATSQCLPCLVCVNWNCCFNWNCFDKSKWYPSCFGYKCELRWLDYYLTERTQFVLYEVSESKHCKLHFGVPPQGSVLGPLRFAMDIIPLGDVIRSFGIGFNCYADDTQLFIPVEEWFSTIYDQTPRWPYPDPLAATHPKRNN